MKKNSVYVIAEIGNNHEGKLSTAKKLIKEAKKSGADAVKFQTFKLENFVRNDYPSFNRLKKFQLSFKEFTILKNYSKKLKIDFISTPLDLESAKFLSDITNTIKISSGDNNFYDLIYFLAKKRKKIIVSTGLINFVEIKKLINFLIKNFGKNFLKNKFILLHCVTSYPVDDCDSNLNSISYLIDKFNKYKFKIGYSDHTIGMLSPILAVALGAKVIEKHFTLNNNFSDFRDHKISLNPDDMKKMIFQIRRATKLLGSYDKEVGEKEKKLIISARRTLFAKNKIDKNQILSEQNLLYLRSLNKKKTDLRKLYISKKAKRSYKKGEQIE